MQVILIKDVNALGKKGEIKNVSNGYARNFLLPQKLVTLATKTVLEQLSVQKKSEQEIKESSRLRSRQAKNQLIKSDILKINNKKITFKVKASEKGTLFKAISKSDIIKAAGEQLKLEITKEYLKLYKPLKEVGEHQVKLKLSGKQANLIIEVLKNNGKEK